MTAEQVAALLCHIASLVLANQSLAAENAELRRSLALAAGDVGTDEQALSDLARAFA